MILLAAIYIVFIFIAAGILAYVFEDQGGVRPKDTLLLWFYSIFWPFTWMFIVGCIIAKLFIGKDK